MVKRQSSRQRMINLMYLVFIAMMALNLSIEVLQGFDIINENLQKAIDNSITRNNQLYKEIEGFYEKNPTKVEDAYKEANALRTKTDSLFNYIDYLKFEIARKTDGEEVENVHQLKYGENIDASSEVMLSPVGGQGNELKQFIDKYREEVLTSLGEEEVSKKELVENALSTKPSDRALNKGVTDWAVASFDRMPSVAVISYLTGIQASVKNAESEVLSVLMKNIDATDLRFNELTAFVIPQSDIVVEGMPYKARVVLGAVDKTQKPGIYVGGRRLPESADGVFSMNTSSPGVHPFSGFVEIIGRDGQPIRKPFRHEYTVIEPMATVAPLLMNVVYAGIPNELSISVPGIVQDKVSAKAYGGSLTPNGGNWIARPGKVGGTFEVEVFINTNGVEKSVGKKKFKIKQLPNPTAFIGYKDKDGHPKKYITGAIPRNVLLNSRRIEAAIDDGILDIPFTVKSFTTLFFDVMGNADVKHSNGSNFTQEQIAAFQKLGRGKRFIITSIKVVGPDKVEREIPAMDVRLN